MGTMFVSTDPSDGLIKCGPMFEPPAEWQCVGVAKCDILTTTEGAVFRTPSGRYMLAAGGRVHVLDPQETKAALYAAIGKGTVRP